MSKPLTVIQIGNFKPEHSTENHLKRALEHNGHWVTALQEDEQDCFLQAMEAIHSDDVDFVLWTRTGWDWNHIFGNTFGTEIAHARQRLTLDAARTADIPVVGYHLDRWFDLNREHQLTEEPFFECDLVVTADGGNQARFEELGIEHHWMPPGVSLAECELGMFRDEFHSKLAFVGSWQGGYHVEHQHRFELVDWLRKNFRRDCAFWPKQGQPAVRGADLRDLYASVDVVVGDSCWAGSDKGDLYWSDRCPETTGRGGFLIHPWVKGLGEAFPDLQMWPAGDWDALGQRIEWALSHPAERRELALELRQHVLREHTYERRMTQLVELLESR